MDITKNIFISHKGEDDESVQRLKERLKENGYDVRNSSVDSTKHQDKRPPDEKIKQDLKDGINWAGTFICLLGPDTYTSDWVNFEIEQAHLMGKRIVGIYIHGSNEAVELPEAFKKYGGPPIGWNSLDKLMDVLDGENIPAENPDGTIKEPIYTITRVKC